MLHRLVGSHPCARRARRQFLASALACAALVTTSCADDAPGTEPDADGLADATLDAGADTTDGSGQPAVVPIDAYPALSAPVEVIRDAQGVPHIFAANDLDLFFAAGYVQASDRLFALDMERRASVGGRAEVLGEAGVAGDIQALALGFGRWAVPSVAALREAAPADHNLLVAWTAGINAYVDEVRNGDAPMPEQYTALGFEPTPFALSDPLAIGLRFTFGFSSTLEFDLLNTVIDRLVADRVALPVHQPVTSSFTMELPGSAASKSATVTLTREEQLELIDWVRTFRRELASGEGSNAWAIAGAHTASGRPILANDSHASFRAPSRLYAMHLNSADAGGTFDVAGVGFMGVPGVQVGHNRQIAWGATTNFADQTDLWDVAIRDGMVTYGDQQLAVVTTEEPYRVRLEDGSFEERIVLHREVPGVGVLLPEELIPVPQALVARGDVLLGWPGFAPNLDLITYLGFDRADSLDAFEAAVDTQRTGMQNWVAISEEGYRYHVQGLVPDRRDAGGQPEASLIMDGSDPMNTWTGAMLSPDRFPRDNGLGAFHTTANNDPWGHTDDNNPLNDAFYYGSWFAPQFRSGRLFEVLPQATDAGGITVEETEALQMEVFSPAAERFRALMDAAWQAAESDASLAALSEDADALAAKGVLDAWDLQMATDAPGAALYRLWVAIVAQQLLEDDITLLFAAIEEAQPVYVVKLALLLLEAEASPFRQADRDALILETLAQAYVEWTAREQPTWGELHDTRFRRSEGGFASEVRAGGDSSLNVAQCRMWVDGALADQCVSDQGAVYRMVHTIDVTGTPTLRWNLPYVIPEATQDWLDGVYRTVPFSRDAIEAQATARETLTP